MPHDQPDLKRDDREAKNESEHQHAVGRRHTVDGASSTPTEGGQDGPGNREGRRFRPVSGRFSTQGAEKRGQHGSKGANVFRDPNDADRVWAVFDWDDAGWQSFTSDPDVPAIFQQAGFTEGPPKAAEFVREHHA